jgi:hypothetical protein
MNKQKEKEIFTIQTIYIFEMTTEDHSFIPFERMIFNRINKRKQERLTTGI